MAKICSRLSTTECNLVKAKALFFVVTLSVVGWTRFQNSFYIDNGLSNTEIGTLKSVGLLCKLVGEPLLCMLADITGHREMFLFCIFFNALSIEVLRVASPLSFRTVFGVKVLRTLAAPTSTLTTTTTMALAEGSKQGYGEQRAFGALGWGVGALLSGFLIDIAGMDALFFYTYALCGTTFLIVYFGVPRGAGRKAGAAKSETPEEELALLLESAPPRELGRGAYLRAGSGEGEGEALGEGSRPEAKPPAAQAASLTSKYQLISGSVSLYYSALCVKGGRAMNIVLLNVGLFGVVMSAMDTYLYVSAERDLEASRTANGLLTTISVGVSVPLFWYSDQLLRRYGHQRLFLASFAVSIFRLIICAIVTKFLIHRKPLALSIIAVLQLLHGLTFASYWSTVIDVTTALCSGQGLLSGSLAVINALYFTVGGAVGNVWWGFVYDDPRAGMVAVYICAACVTILCFALQLLWGSGVDDMVALNRGISNRSTSSTS